MADQQSKTKRCYRCKQWLDRENFGRNRAKLDGRADECWECRREVKRESYQRHRAECVARATEWKRKNPEKAKEAGRRYRRRYAAHLKNKREENREKAGAYGKQYYAENREVFKKKAVEYYEAHREQRIEAARAYAEANPDKRRRWSIQCQNKRRAAANGTPRGEVVLRQVLDRDGFWCYLCRRNVAPSQLSFDHVIPLSKGGANTPENMKVVHRRCNSKKHNKILTLF